MEAAKLSRRQRKAALTRFLGDLQRHCADSDGEAVKQTLEKLRSAFDEFQKSHDMYHNMLMQDNTLADSDIDASDDWYSKVVANYSDGMAAANAWLNKADSDDVTGPCKDTQDRHTELIDMLSMPKTELDVFNGDPLEFQSFMAVFDETVDCKKIDDQVKLTRLLQYTSGPAKSAIKNCSLVGGKEGYQQARSNLKARFGDSHLISERITSRLLSGKSVSKAADVQQFADEISGAFSALSKMSMTSEIDNQRTIKDILKRCPLFIRHKWQQRALNSKREKDKYPDFANFVEFMKKMASDCSDP